MQRKNKNIILITMLVVFLSLSLIFYQGLTTREDINSSYDRSINEIYGNNDYYFPDSKNDTFDSVTSTKMTRKTQVVKTIIMSILVILSIQITFFLLFSGFNYLTFHLTFFPLAKIGVYLILSLGLTGFVLVNMIKPITFLPADSIVEENPDPKDNQSSLQLEGTDVTDKNIDLSKYNENILLTRGGTYEVEGDFSHTIIVNCNGDITLQLKNVNIKSTNAPGIANIGEGKLKIETLEATTSSLTLEGTSSYEASLYSSGPLELKGNGTLNITATEATGINVSSNDFTLSSGSVTINAKDYGIITSKDGGLINITNGNLDIQSTLANLKSKQNLIIDGGLVYLTGTEEDASIDTVNGYEINGGTLISLGKDIYETPLTSSKNYTICLKLKDIIKKDSVLSLMDSKEKEILTFLATDDFNSLVISSKDIKKDTYSLYKDGSSNGSLENNIYKNGTYSGGSLVDKSIEVTSKITTKK